MMITRALILIGSVAVSSAVGCANPAITSVSPVAAAGAKAPVPPPPAAGTAAVTPPTPVAGTAAVTPPPAAGTAAVTPPTPVAGTAAVMPPTPTAGASGAPAMPQAGTAAGTSAPVAGMGAAGTSVGAAGSSSAGTGGGPPGKCPSGWTCTDLSTLGATAVDGAGNPITTSCGNGMLVDCKDANPAASCAPLTAPFCAHIKVAGMDLVSCGQRCTP
jgi:hypothetical protein